MDDTQIQQYKSAMEALLFVSDKPIILDQLKQVFAQLKPAEVEEVIKKLQDEYADRNAGTSPQNAAHNKEMHLAAGNHRAVNEHHDFRAFP